MGMAEVRSMKSVVCRVVCVCRGHAMRAGGAARTGDVEQRAKQQDHRQQKVERHHQRLARRLKCKEPWHRKGRMRHTTQTVLG